MNVISKRDFFRFAVGIEEPPTNFPGPIFENHQLEIVEGDDFAELIEKYVGCGIAVAAVGDRIRRANQRCVTLDRNFHPNG
jgi:hypothetical protein